MCVCVCVCTFPAWWSEFMLLLSDSVAEPSHDSPGRTRKVFQGRQWQQRIFYLSARGTTASPALHFSAATVCCKPSVAAVSSSGGLRLISWTLLRSDAWGLELPDCNRHTQTLYWLECRFSISYIFIYFPLLITKRMWHPVLLFFYSFHSKFMTARAHVDIQWFFFPFSCQRHHSCRSVFSWGNF